MLVGRWLAPVTAFAMALVVAACGGPSPAPSLSAAPVHAVVTEGRFQLTFELPSATWKTSDSITGLATLTLTQGDHADLTGASGGLLAFEFAEVGGDRHTQPIWDAACAQHPLSPGKPMTSGIVKSGAYQGDAPPGDFNRQFITDPLVRLPAGTWDITAIAMFDEGPTCSAPSHEMRETVRLTVTE